MSQLQVTKITTVDNTTPLILATGNAGGGQIIVQSSNTDVFFNGNINFSNYVTGDGSGLFLPTSNVANAAFNTANAAYASANNVAPQVTPAFNTANVAFDTANAAFASANNVAPQVEPSFRTANAAFVHANAAYDAANNVGPQIAPTFNTANSAFAQANIASNTATGAYNAANAAYNNANAAFNAANGKFSSSGGTISGAVEITADLTVHGNTRFIDQQTLSVGDPLIYLAANNYTSDVVDIGFVANYVNSTSANVHTGLYRSSGTKEYYLFYGYDKEPINNYIDPTGNNIQQAVLNSTLRTSNVILGGANAINWIRSAYAQANAGGANVGQTAPTGVSSGKLWWNSDLGKLYVYYTDPANTSSWVETSPSASAIESAIITGYINPVFNTINAAYTSSNANYVVSNSAFAKANAAIANTTGTFQGTLTVTGNLIVGTGTTTITNNAINIANAFIATAQSIIVPSGTTSQRPAGTNGMIRYNTTTGLLEQYSSLGWQAIASPPVVTSVTPSTPLGNSNPQVISIIGSGFDSGATVQILGTNQTTVYVPDTVTIISPSNITVTFANNNTLTGTGRSGSGEPYAVKVLNSTGLSYVLTSAFNINDVPTWSTPAGSLGTANTTGSYTYTLSATDPEASGLTYSILTGSLPGGLNLGSSNGVIQGTTSGGSYSAGGTTFNFTVAANDGSQSAIRTFSIIQKWYDGSTADQAAASADAIKTLTGTSTSGLYYIKPSSWSYPIQAYCEMSKHGGGWIYVMQRYCYSTGGSSSNLPGSWLVGKSGSPNHATSDFYGYTDTNGTTRTAQDLWSALSPLSGLCKWYAREIFSGWDESQRYVSSSDTALYNYTNFARHFYGNYSNGSWVNNVRVYYNNGSNYVDGKYSTTWSAPSLATINNGNTDQDQYFANGTDNYDSNWAFGLGQGSSPYPRTWSNAGGARTNVYRWGIIAIKA